MPRDVVFGGSGNDNIGGMAGRDVVDAELGNDLIAWNDPTSDVPFGGDGADRILGRDVAADEIHGGVANDVIRVFADQRRSRNSFRSAVWRRRQRHPARRERR